MSDEEPDLQDYKIEVLYAAIAVGEDGREGIVGMMTENGWLPIVFSDRSKRDKYKAMLARMATAGGVKVELRTYQLVKEERL